MEKFFDFNLVNLLSLLGIIWLLFRRQKQQTVQTLISAVTGKISKKILEAVKYFNDRFSEILKTLPDELPVPSNVEEVVNKKNITEEEMVKGHEEQFFTEEEAFGLAAKYVQEKKNGYLIWYKNSRDVICLLCIWHDGDGPNIDVNEFVSSYGWSESLVSVFRT